MRLAYFTVVQVMLTAHVDFEVVEFFRHKRLCLTTVIFAAYFRFNNNKPLYRIINLSAYMTSFFLQIFEFVS